MEKKWKLVEDESNDPKLFLYHYELVTVEREYCPICKVMFVEDKCFCEWEE